MSISSVLPVSEFDPGLPIEDAIEKINLSPYLRQQMEFPLTKTHWQVLQVDPHISLSAHERLYKMGLIETCEWFAVARDGSQDKYEITQFTALGLKVLDRLGILHQWVMAVFDPEPPIDESDTIPLNIPEPVIDPEDTQIVVVDLLACSSPEVVQAAPSLSPRELYDLSFAIYRKFRNKQFRKVETLRDLYDLCDKMGIPLRYMLVAENHWWDRQKLPHGYANLDVRARQLQLRLWFLRLRLLSESYLIDLENVYGSAVAA